MKIVLLVSLSLTLFGACLQLFAQSNYTSSGVSLEYPGNINSYVDLGDSYNSLTFPFSLECWVYQASVPAVTNVVFASDNSTTGYSGFIIHLNSLGLIDFEFADNSGSGPNNRRGVISTETVPVNKWVHIACVANSPDNMKIFINGVSSPTTVSGNSNLTSMISNSSHAFIGKRIDPYGSYTYYGELDEVRLWNVGRSGAEIRTFMCRKIDSTTSGLIGYWKADESYAGTILHDCASPAEDGIISGNINKNTSGAPIGDSSIYKYPSSWSGLELTLAASFGDSIKAIEITGNPYGVHLYSISSPPYYINGLNSACPYYFGIFAAEDGGAAMYKMVYSYLEGNGLITYSNENLSAVMSKESGAIPDWNLAASNPDTFFNSLEKSNEVSRGEYILNINFYILASDTALCEKFCIDFLDQSSNNPISWQWIFEGANPPGSTDQNPVNICYDDPGIFDVTLITINAYGSNDTLFLADYITVFTNPFAPVITQNGNMLISSPASSYQWLFNGIIIPGATNQEYLITQSGLYTVIIGDTNGCSAQADIKAFFTGVGAIEPSWHFDIYPNPSTGNFILELLTPALPITGYDKKQDITIEISNLFGQTLFISKDPWRSDFKKEIELETSANGIYFIELTIQDYTIRSKTIVRK